MTKDLESAKHRKARRKLVSTTELNSLVSDGNRALKTIRYKRNIDAAGAPSALRQLHACPGEPLMTGVAEGKRYLARAR